MCQFLTLHRTMGGRHCWVKATGSMEGCFEVEVEVEGQGSTQRRQGARERVPTRAEIGQPTW